MANPNPNQDNLVQNQGLSRGEVERINQKGGIASGEARRKQKAYKEFVELFGELKPNEEEVSLLKKAFPELKEEDIDNTAVVVGAQYAKAFNGDTKAAEYLRDTSGQKPTDKLDTNLTTGPSMTDKQAEEALLRVQGILRKNDTNE